MSVHVQLDQFEGPLALLLYLIRKDEMDIHNIPIHRITQQYLDFIRVQREIDLESAGEFVSMAATLLQIKSRILLPQYGEQGEEVPPEDPRKELVQRLLHYQKFQELAKQLSARKLLNRDVWARGVSDAISDEANHLDPLAETMAKTIMTTESQDLASIGPINDVVVDEGALFEMIRMFKTLLQKAQKRVHTVYAKGQSIASRILEIKDFLIPGQRSTLREIVSGESGRSKLLITFLSLLELGRLGFISLFQNEAYADIHIDTKQNIERDVVTRVEEFERKVADVAVEGILQDVISESVAIESASPDLAEDVNGDNRGATDDEILQAELELEPEMDIAPQISAAEIEGLSSLDGMTAFEATDFDEETQLVVKPKEGFEGTV